MKDLLLKASFIFLAICARTWAQPVPTNTPTSTPTSSPTASPMPTPVLLFPAPTVTDFQSNSMFYSLYQYNPSNNNWNRIQATNQTSGNAIGMLAPVTTFNGQYAVVRSQPTPSSDSHSYFPSNMGCCGTNHTNGGDLSFTIGGSSQSAEVKIYDTNGELVRDLGTPSLPPGNYNFHLNNPGNVAFNEYFLYFYINGSQQFGEAILWGN